MTVKKPHVKQIRDLGTLGVFPVEALEIEFANGAERTYYRLNAKHDAVTVLAFDQEKIYLISEYAGGTLDYELGFPRGGMDAGEDILTAAARELGEEVSLQAQSYHHLTSFYNSTGYQCSQMHVVIAQGLTPVTEELEGDEPEPLEIIAWPLERLDELLTHPRFRDCRNLLALYSFRDWLQQQDKNKVA